MTWHCRPCRVHQCYTTWHCKPCRIHQFYPTFSLKALSHPPVLLSLTPYKIFQATNRSLPFKWTTTTTRTTSKIGKTSNRCTTLPVLNAQITLWKSLTTSLSGASRARCTMPMLPLLPLLRGMVSCCPCWNPLKLNKSLWEKSRYVIGTMYGCIAYLFVARLTMACTYVICAPRLTLNRNPMTSKITVLWTSTRESTLIYLHPLDLLNSI